MTSRDALELYQFLKRTANLTNEWWLWRLNVVAHRMLLVRVRTTAPKIQAPTAVAVRATHHRLKFDRNPLFIKSRCLVRNTPRNAIIKRKINCHQTYRFFNISQSAFVHLYRTAVHLPKTRWMPSRTTKILTILHLIFPILAINSVPSSISRRYQIFKVFLSILLCSRQLDYR